jgi:pimeloyl-ACP methyl ester carboxylesterase
MQLADTPRGVSSIGLQVVAINGHEVAYRRAGEGPVVLLVHGMAGSSVTWNHVMSSLARRFTVVAPDLLGHGESAKPHGEYSLGAHADILRGSSGRSVPSSTSAGSR